MGETEETAEDRDRRLAHEAARHVARSPAGGLLPHRVVTAARRAIDPDRVNRPDVRPALEAWISHEIIALIMGQDGAHPLPPWADVGEHRPRTNAPTARAEDVEAGIRHLLRPGTSTPDSWALLLPGLEVEVEPLARHTVRAHGGLVPRTGVRIHARHRWLPRGEVSIVALAEDL